LEATTGNINYKMLWLNKKLTFKQNNKIFAEFKVADSNRQSKNNKKHIIIFINHLLMQLGYPINRYQDYKIVDYTK
jgi:hypothetical protein